MERLRTTMALDRTVQRTTDNYEKETSSWTSGPSKKHRTKDGETTFLEKRGQWRAEERNSTSTRAQTFEALNSFQNFTSKCPKISHVSHACYITRPFILPETKKRLQIMKLIFRFIPFSLRSEYSPKPFVLLLPQFMIPFRATAQATSSFKVRDKTEVFCFSVYVSSYNSDNLFSPQYN